MDRMPALIIKGLTKKYGNHRILNQVNLTLNLHKVYGLVGLNGVGKSTLIRCITALIPIDEGTIHIFGENCTPDNISIRKRTGVLMENLDDVFAYLKGYEYLRFLGRLMGYNKKLLSNRIEELQSFFSMDGAMEKVIYNYSKGMKKKIAIMGLLLRNPDLYILDEPFEGLDPLTIIKINKILFQLSSSGKTIFLTSHILAYIEKIADYVFILHQGNIIMESPTMEIKNKLKKSIDIKKYHSLEEIFTQLTEQDKEESLSWI